MVSAVGQATWLRMAALGQRLDRKALETLSPMLILAPHPDDETLGCGGLIATAAAMGLGPRIAYLTDGAASHPGSRAWPPRRLAAVRREEALEALAVLGAPARDVLFLDWPDAAPHAPNARAYQVSLDTLQGWMGRAGPRSVWAPWRGEQHCDHAAAADLARRLVRRTRPGAILMSYLVWGWREPRLARAARRETVWTLHCPRTVGRRRAALARHRTQTTPMIDDAAGAFRIPPELAALTDRPTEIYLSAA